jgi:heterodisulfide reductase subunit C
MFKNPILQKSIDPNFIREIERIPGGERIIDCIQCGTCSGSCPTSPLMDYTPRKLFAMIRAGLKDEVLNCNTFWYCTSCYYCTVRCPQQIKITDIMYALKRLALQSGPRRRGDSARVFYETFVGIVERDGKSFEPELMTRYMLGTNPLLMLKSSILGLKLIRHRRFPFRRHTIKARNELKKIIKAAKSEKKE